MQTLIQSIPWWAFAVLANLAVILQEWVFRSSPTYAKALVVTLPFMVLANYCLYRTFSGASAWLLAWVVFTLGNSSMRVASVALTSQHEVRHWATVILGIAIMLCGAYLLKKGLG